jgi:hypothetical protein
MVGNARDRLSARLDEKRLEAERVEKPWPDWPLRVNSMTVPWRLNVGCPVILLDVFCQAVAVTLWFLGWRGCGLRNGFGREFCSDTGGCDQTKAREEASPGDFVLLCHDCLHVDVVGILFNASEC